MMLCAGRPMGRRLVQSADAVCIPVKRIGSHFFDFGMEHYRSACKHDAAVHFPLVNL